MTQKGSVQMENNPANGIKDLMWKFLMEKGQKENIPELKDSVYRLIQMTTQKTAGQRKTSTHISWETLDMEIMRIVIEATALVLSGRLDELETDSVKYCKDCEYHDDFSHACFGAGSPKCADYTDNDYCCDYYKKRSETYD